MNRTVDPFSSIFFKVTRRTLRDEPSTQNHAQTRTSEHIHPHARRHARRHMRKHKKDARAHVNTHTDVKTLPRPTVSWTDSCWLEHSDRCY